MEVYERVAYFQMFKQIPEIADGFKREHLNVVIDGEAPDRFEALLASKGKDFDQRGLTEIQMSRYQKRAQQDMDLSPQEMESIREFFDEEIRGRDALAVVLTYKMLFRDISSQSLKMYLISQITKYKGNDFAFFHRLACVAVKATSPRQQLEFIFDLFSDFDVEMSVMQFDELCKMLHYDETTKYSLDKEEFVEIFERENYKFDILREAKYMFIATMSIKNEGTH